MTKLSDFVPLTKITIFNFHSLSSKHFFIHEISQWVNFKILKLKKSYIYYFIKHTRYIYTKEVVSHLDTDQDGVITFDEFILPYDIDFEDQSQATQKRLEIERRAFDNRDSNLNGALEGQLKINLEIIWPKYSKNA